MNVGGSVGPAGTRSKLGPVIQLPHTQQLEGENHTADSGPDFHRGDLRLRLRARATPRPMISVRTGFFLLDRSLTTPSPPHLSIASPRSSPQSGRCAENIPVGI